MAGDGFHKPLPGQPFRPDARAWGYFLDAASAEKNRAHNAEANLKGLRPSATTILCRNSTGGSLNQFWVVGVAGPIILPSQNLTEFKQRATIDGTTPLAGKFAILQEPLELDAIGRAVIAGVTVGRVLVTPDTQLFGFADAIPGDPSQLALAASGGAQVLWYDPAVTDGTAWALLRLGMPGGGERCADPFTFVTNYCSSTDTVEYRTYYPATCQLSAPFCVVGPSNCCLVGGQCCPGVTLPRQLCGTLTSSISFLNGIKVTLTYTAGSITTPEGYYGAYMTSVPAGDCSPIPPGIQLEVGVSLTCIGNEWKALVSIVYFNSLTGGRCAFVEYTDVGNGFSSTDCGPPFNFVTRSRTITKDTFSCSVCGKLYTEADTISVTFAPDPCTGSSGGSGSSGGTITATGQGAAATSGTGDGWDGADWTALRNITVPPNALLIVASGGPATATASAITFAGFTLEPANASADDVNLDIGQSFWRNQSVITVTGDIVIVGATPGHAYLMFAVVVTGLTFAFTPDATVHASGTAGSPDTGVSPATNIAAEYIQAALLCNGSEGTWQHSFTGGSMTASVVVGADTWAIFDGYRVLSSTGTYQAATNSTPTKWGISAASYD